MDRLSARRPNVRRAALAAVFVCALGTVAAAQDGNGNILYGDLKVDESKTEGQKPLAFDIVLYMQSGTPLGRQSIPNGGRYRFNDIANGWYILAVEVEGAEVARMRVQVFSNYKTDIRQDIALEWRARAGPRPASVAADAYKRASPAQKLYDRAEEAMTAKRYADASTLFRQIVGSDAQDYEAWLELGTAQLFQEQYAEAEKSYQRASEAKPDLALPLVNLGRLRVLQKNYEGAVEALSKAVALKPPSADANFLLGESYLQLKKGSKAVAYLEEAARLGRPDARLRLATLYNAVGLKDRAAAEYEQYLKEKPDAPDRKKLEQYVKENKKQ
jgi:tetratricopeptide (TPR) repeat protein